MGKFKDISGQKFGRLTVIKQVSRPNNIKDKHTYWLCKCDCGKEVIVAKNCLLDKRGGTKSCGCLQKELSKKGRKPIENTYISSLTQKQRKSNTSGRKRCLLEKGKRRL